MPSPVRKITRLRGFDYRSNETYFVTICLKTRSPLFGHVGDDALLVQSTIGNMIALTWISIPDRFPSVAVDDFVVMPDHLHGLLTFDCDDGINASPALGDVVGWFKGKTTFLYGEGVKNRDWPRYAGNLWQPRFHDHIIRDARDFDARVSYIEQNPWRWFENRKGK